SSPYLSYTSSYGGYNYIRRYTSASQSEVNAGCTSGCTTGDWDHTGGTTNNKRYAHLKHTSDNYAIVPFPIQIFDTREGEHYDARSSTYYYDQDRLTRNGVMSMVDIDMANLRRFLRGDYDGLFPVDTPFAVENG